MTLEEARSALGHLVTVAATGSVSDLRGWLQDRNGRGLEEPELMTEAPNGQKRPPSRRSN